MQAPTNRNQMESELCEIKKETDRKIQRLTDEIWERQDKALIQLRKDSSQDCINIINSQLVETKQELMATINEIGDALR